MTPLSRDHFVVTNTLDDPSTNGGSPRVAEDRSGERLIGTRISSLIVGLMSSYIGRGPTKCWTFIDDDLVTVVLRDTLTKGERNLIASGQEQMVLELRRTYQRTMRDELIAGVEKVIERKVIAFLADSHIDPDITIKSFVLDGRATDRTGSSRRNDEAGPVSGPE
ncbi:MAG: Na-translocating system protein MpsC family protein [Solirubrobacteraceae bacterium]|jgi:uncharacterized protein YbcI